MKQKKETWYNVIHTNAHMHKCTRMGLRALWIADSRCVVLCPCVYHEIAEQWLYRLEMLHLSMISARSHSVTRARHFTSIDGRVLAQRRFAHNFFYNMCVSFAVCVCVWVRTSLCVCASNRHSRTRQKNSQTRVYTHIHDTNVYVNMCARVYTREPSGKQHEKKATCDVGDGRTVSEHKHQTYIGKRRRTNEKNHHHHHRHHHHRQQQQPKTIRYDTIRITHSKLKKGESAKAIKRISRIS